MTTFIIYIIKWAFALTVLYSLYGLILRRETFHRINRAVLLFILLSSMALPLCNIELKSSNPITQGAQRIEQVVKEEAERSIRDATNTGYGVDGTGMTNTAEAFGLSHKNGSSSTHVNDAEETSSTFPWLKILVVIYLLGLIIHLVRYFINLCLLTRIIYKGKRVMVEGIDSSFYIILTPKAVMPMSWMRWILVNEQDIKEPCLLQHEAIHLKKGHSWDLLLCELTARLQWFNPLAWMLCHDLRDIHEYEVDREVVKTGTNRDVYEELIIERSTQTALQCVTNGLKHSIIKDRLWMMYAKPSSRLAWLKVLYLVPLLGLSLLVFAKPNLIKDIRLQLGFEDTMEVNSFLNQLKANTANESEGEGEERQDDWNWKEADYYVYCQDSGQINMDCEILMLYTQGKRYGKFYGNSDEFMDCREGFYPGFYVLDVCDLERHQKHISFYITASQKRFLNAPVSLKFTSHLEALSHEAYEPWLQTQNVLTIQEVTFTGTFIEDGIWLNNNSLYPDARQVDKKFFKKVKREELEAYGIQLLDKENRANNSYSYYDGRGWPGNEADVVVSRQGKVYNLLETTDEGYVCYAQDYLLIPYEEGEQKHFSAVNGQGYVHPIGREKQDTQYMPNSIPRNPNWEVVLFEAPSFDSPVTGGIALNKNSCFDCYPCLGYINGFFKMELTGDSGESSGGVHYVSDHQMVWSPAGIGWAN